MKTRVSLKYFVSYCRFFLLCTFGNFLVPVLVAAHSVNKVNLDHDQSFENEGYESE